MKSGFRYFLGFVFFFGVFLGTFRLVRGEWRKEAETSPAENPLEREIDSVLGDPNPSSIVRRALEAPQDLLAAQRSAGEEGAAVPLPEPVPVGPDPLRAQAVEASVGVLSTPEAVTTGRMVDSFLPLRESAVADPLSPENQALEEAMVRMGFAQGAHPPRPRPTSPSTATLSR